MRGDNTRRGRSETVSDKQTGNVGTNGNGIAGSTGSTAGGPTLFVEERQRRIMDVLQEQKRVSVNALSESFGVSASTLRNDLRDMEARGLVQRTHGGAVLPEHPAFDEPVSITGLVASKEKQKIGHRAASMVKDGEVIFVDNGATALAFIHALEDRRGLTVVTPDLAIACFANDHIPDSKVIVLGGLMRHGFTFTTGVVPCNEVRAMNISTAFFGAPGFTVERGFSVSTLEGADLKRLVIRNASRCVMMVDSKKFGSNAAISYATLTECNVLITDRGIPERDRVAIESLIEGPSLVLV